MTRVRLPDALTRVNWPDVWSRGRWPAAGVLAVILTITVWSCSQGVGDATRPAAEREPAVEQPKIEITPGDGSKKVRPEKGVTVTSSGGTLENVTLQVGDDEIEGELDDDGTTWKSTGKLKPSKTYQVAASAKSPSGGAAEITSTFKTLKPAGTLSIADVTPSSGEKVGVGMPIMVRFNRSVGNKETVEKALKVESEEDAEGAWRWIGSDQVIYRTKEYWKADQKVTFKADLDGVRAGKNIYGMKDFSRSFKIGEEHISTVDTKTHRMKVKHDGKVVKNVGISAGKGGRIRNGIDVYLTASGVHLTMSRHRMETMTSEWMGVDPEDKANGGYKLDLPWAVRISNSGEYVHSMTNYWAQGRRNVSHGCVNSPPPFAKWFYNNFQRGDVVDVTGSKRKLPWNNGWSYWQLSYDEWKKGSALD